MAEEGSFLGASRRLGIHHSALSRRIRDLEHSLGTTLFERHPVGVRLTPAGATMLRSLRRVLTDLDSTLATVGNAREGQAYNLPTDFEAPLSAIALLDAVPKSPEAGQVSASVSWTRTASRRTYPDLMSRRTQLNAFTSSSAIKRSCGRRFGR
ncbi:LysR family transcriptional regulator [Mesorhizobium australicum]|uniref:LysR family transcriptional regulator n=1 Tax=Mesorhizobium australicum TaxID=536018 RepID=UPI003335C2D2